MKLILKYVLSVLLMFLIIGLFGCIKPEDLLENEEDELNIIESISDTDFLIPGHTYEIKWTSYKASESITIELYGTEVNSVTNESVKILTIADNIYNNGLYQWTIPEDFIETYGNSFRDNEYKIILNSEFSEHKYTISFPSINIQSPAISQELIAGNTNNIEYEYTGSNFYGSIDLYKGNEYLLEIIF